MSQAELSEQRRRREDLEERDRQSRQAARRASELKTRAIKEIEKEHIYVKGGSQAIEAKMIEIEARDKARREH